MVGGSIAVATMGQSGSERQFEPLQRETTGNPWALIASIHQAGATLFKAVDFS